MNFKNSFYISIMLTLLYNCSSGGDDPTNSNPNTSVKITYESHINSITTNYCIACHGEPPSSGAPMSLTSYELVKNAVETRGLINRINSTTNPMPPKGGLLSKEQRDLIQKWVDDGLLEK